MSSLRLRRFLRTHQTISFKNPITHPKSTRKFCGRLIVTCSPWCGFVMAFNKRIKPQQARRQFLGWEKILICTASNFLGWQPSFTSHTFVGNSLPIFSCKDGPLVGHWVSTCFAGVRTALCSTFDSMTYLVSRHMCHQYCSSPKLESTDGAERAAGLFRMHNISWLCVNRRNMVPHRGTLSTSVILAIGQRRLRYHCRELMLSVTRPDSVSDSQPPSELGDVWHRLSCGEIRRFSSVALHLPVSRLLHHCLVSDLFCIAGQP